MEDHDFGWALKKLLDGCLVQRSGWNGKGMWVRIRQPSAGSDMTAPYIYMRTARAELVPWVASQADILSHDWEVIRPES